MARHSECDEECKGGPQPPAQQRQQPLDLCELGKVCRLRPYPRWRACPRHRYLPDVYLADVTAKHVRLIRGGGQGWWRWDQGWWDRW